MEGTELASQGGDVNESRAITSLRVCRWNCWLALLLTSVFFTPNIQLPGRIPLRLEDILIFGTGLIACCRAVYKLQVKRSHWLWIYLVLVPLSILICTVVVAVAYPYPVEIKEYLDLLRPVKFLIVFLVLEFSDHQATRRTFIRIMGSSMIVLSLIAVFQLLFIRVNDDGLLMKFFLMYTELDPAHARLMLAMRPFATFNTPTDLGYVSAIGIFVGFVLFSGSWRKWIVASSLLALVISETRTFLFSLPLLLMIEIWMTARSARQVLKRLTYTAMLALVGVALLLSLGHVGEGVVRGTVVSVINGNAQNEESIADRINNLFLAEYTWEHARWFGVVTRSMLGVAADSELLYTFHRYGLVGLSMLLAFYPLGYACIRKCKHDDPQMATFAVFVLGITFIYGITQGAMINTRIGVLPIAVLGIISSELRKTRDSTLTMPVQLEVLR